MLDWLAAISALACCGLGFALGAFWRRRRFRLLERSFWNVFDETSVAYHDVDMGGIVRRVNRAACDLLGYQLSDLLGHEVWEFLAPGLRPAARESIRRKASGSEALKPTQREYLTGNGKSKIIEIHENFLRDYSGAPVGIRSALVDVTDRVRAAEVLRESEERFRRMADSAPVLIWMTGAAGECTYCNRAWAEFTGCEGACEGWSPHLHPDDCAAYSATRSEAQREQRKFQTELRVRRADGRYRWILECGVPRLAPAGGFAGFIGCAVDITDRRVAETALRESEERFRLLVENVREYALLMLDVDGRITSWNSGAERIYGYPADEALGRYVSMFYPIAEVEAGEPRAVLAQAAHQGRVQIEKRRLRKDGSGFWASVTISAIRDEQGNLKGFASVTRDITEWKTTEERLRLLESVVVNAREGVLVAALDAAGGTAQIVYMNAALEGMSGFSASDLAGARLDYLIDPAAEPALKASVLESFRRAEAFDVAMPLRCRDGRSVWVEADYVPVIDGSGRVTHLVGIQRDITERRHAERRIQSYAAELEQKNSQLEQALLAAQEAAQLKSRFLANMSHEIRTPMNGVLGMLELLANSGVNAEQTQFLQTARSSANSLLAMIDDIIDLSRIESGKVTLESEPFQPRQLLRDELATHEARAREKKLALESSIAPEAPAEVYGDPARVRRIIRNLVANAIKFTEKGRVRVGLEVAGRGADTVTLRFVIKDTGIGIGDEQRRFLFERFSQADSSMTRKFGGSGLGLAISKQLAELMGGEIGVESAPGQGSVFWFTATFGVPAARPRSVQPAKTRDARPEPCLGGRVLLAEDNPVNQQIARRMLEKRGYSAKVVNNGLEAVEAITNADFDLVLMDIQMPVMDGLEAAARIREIESEGRHTPIVAMTANAMAGDRDRCIAAGMDDYLSKPVALDDLCRTLERWMSVGANSV